MDYFDSGVGLILAIGIGLYIGSMVYDASLWVKRRVTARVIGRSTARAIIETPDAVALIKSALVFELDKVGPGGHVDAQRVNEVILSYCPNAMVYAMASFAVKEWAVVTLGAHEVDPDDE